MSLGFKYDEHREFPDQTTFYFSRGMHGISIQMPIRGKIWWVHSASGDERLYVENEGQTYKGLHEHLAAYFNPSPTGT